MHSIESLLCNFYKNTVNTTGYMFEVLVDIFRYCVIENTTNIKHCENTPSMNNFLNRIFLKKKKLIKNFSWGTPKKRLIFTLSQGVYLTVARGECISPRAGAKLSNTRPVDQWSKCCNTS